MAYLLDGSGKRLTTGNKVLINAPFVSPGTISRIARGLLFADDFSDLSQWSSEGTWQAVASRILAAYPIPRYLLEPGPAGSSDAGGARESHLMTMGGGLLYLFYGGYSGSGGQWLAMLAKSTDYGKTWTHLGDQVGLAKVFTSGNWSARDLGFCSKFGDLYYLHVVDAGSFPNDIPGYEYEDSAYTASSLEGPWTYSSRGPARIPGAFNSVCVTGPCVVYTGGIYYYFYSANDMHTGTIGLATALSPDGPWTDQGQVALANYVTGNQVENPKVFWIDPLDRWVMLVNAYTTGGTDRNRFYLSTSLTDWSSAVYQEFQWAQLGGYAGGHASDIDTTAGDVIGYASPLYLPSGIPSFDSNMVPFSYDGYPTDGNHHGRKILYGVLEPAPNAAYFSGTTEKDMQADVSHTSIVAEFVIYFGAQTGVSAQICFLYRRESIVGPTQNGYQVALIPSPAGNAGVRFGKFVGGAYSQIEANTTFQPAIGRTYRCRIEASGTSHKVYIDGVLVIDATDSQFSSGATVALKGYQCTAYVWNLHCRKSNTVTVNGISGAVALHAPGDLYAAEGSGTIDYTHYPMRGLSAGGQYTRFEDGIYGGDEYEVN